MFVNGFEMVDEAGNLLVKCEEGADLVKAHVSGYANKKGTFVAEHEDKRAASKPSSIGDHHKELMASAKKHLKAGGGDWNLETEDGYRYQSAAEYMRDGDHESLKREILGSDTAQREHICNHIHPDHWPKLGITATNHARSVKEHEARFAKKTAKDG